MAPEPSPQNKKKAQSVRNLGVQEEEEEDKDSLVLDVDNVGQDFQQKLRNSVKTVMSAERGTAAYENEEFVNL